MELFTETNLLEEVGGILFKSLPEQGIWMVLFDGDDNYYSSDEDRLVKYFTGNDTLKNIRQRLDDGGGPIISQIDDSSVVAVDFTVGYNHNCYLMLIFEKSIPEQAIANINLIEMLINQAEQIASHI